jgi:hypothetical protein
MNLLTKGKKYLLKLKISFLQGATFGFAGQMPAKYTQAVMAVNLKFNSGKWLCCNYFLKNRV